MVRTPQRESQNNLKLLNAPPPHQRMGAIQVGLVLHHPHPLAPWPFDFFAQGTGAEPVELVGGEAGDGDAADGAGDEQVLPVALLRRVAQAVGDFDVAQAVDFFAGGDDAAAFRAGGGLKLGQLVQRVAVTGADDVVAQVVAGGGENLCIATGDQFQVTGQVMNVVFRRGSFVLSLADLKPVPALAGDEGIVKAVPVGADEVQARCRRWPRRRKVRVVVQRADDQPNLGQKIGVRQAGKSHCQLRLHAHLLGFTTAGGDYFLHAMTAADASRHLFLNR